MGGWGREYKYNCSSDENDFFLFFVFLEGEGFNNAFIMYSVSKVFLGGREGFRYFIV